MMTGVQRAVVGCIVMGLTACGASSAGAETIDGFDGSGYGSTLDVGQTLRIDLKPANSGSSGYHWRVAKRPKRSVLRLVSSRAVKNRQRFTFQARGAGVTSFKLQYVSPGRHRRVAKTFRHTAAVNRLLPQLDCFGSGRATNLVAQSNAARVFEVNRTIRVFDFSTQRVERVSYEVFLGCAFAENHARELGPPEVELQRGSHATPADVYDVTLRGTVAGYAFRPACPIVVVAVGGCGFTPGTSVVAQDLNGGKLIRDEIVGTSGPDDENRLTGLVVSATGGLAWTELGHEDQTTVGIVLRSDEQPDQSGPFDIERLDSGADLDPDSLYFDGTNISWQNGGKTQKARLR
jgi:hypothetical protein